ncbi:MAG: phosphopyruvate hydratase, partial [Candidatus Komeilibacteria bacterium]|nr:phosphopyruvate hydratase [Candidatus Komeilibacteria bacterium]
MPERNIKSIHAQEILDSRGDPTVHCSVILENGIHGQAAVPSGASTGRFEAYELRDGDMKRYQGKGVLKACSNVNIKIAQALLGRNVEEQEGIDRTMIELDGRHNKSNLGANAILAVSLACAKAAAKARHLPLYKSLQQTFNYQSQPILPTPLMNIINGGKHASTNIALQEFQIIPKIDNTFSRALEAGSEIFHSLGQILNEKKIDSDVGNEGGYAPNVNDIEEVFQYMIEAIGRAGYKAGEQVTLGLDAAATSFADPEAKVYTISPPENKYSPEELMQKYETWLEKYYIKTFEDPFAEES